MQSATWVVLGLEHWFGCMMYHRSAVFDNDLENPWHFSSWPVAQYWMWSQDCYRAGQAHVSGALTLGVAAKTTQRAGSTAGSQASRRKDIFRGQKPDTFLAQPCSVWHLPHLEMLKFACLPVVRSCESAYPWLWLELAHFQAHTTNILNIGQGWSRACPSWSLLCLVQPGHFFFFPFKTGS